MLMIAVVAAGGLIAACASTPGAPTFQGKALSPDYYVPRADHWVIVLDRSTSMADTYMHVRKLDVAESFVGALNETLPEIGYEGALVAFGKGSAMDGAKVQTLVDLAPYKTAAFSDALGTVGKAGSGSPLDCAIRKAAGLLEGTSGTKAIVVVSDGLHMGEPEVAAAQAFKKAAGDQGAVWTVQIGNSPVGRTLLERVAAAGGGKAYLSDSLASQNAMVNFAETVFVAKDSDGDGVPDELDKCPDTPKGVKVDANGCCLDTDKDGVPDYKDKCPNTPAGVKVDANGCCLDTDGDGVPDYKDACPNTPAGTKVDEKGCPVDSDGDGVTDDKDKCPNTPAGIPVDETGCPPTGILVHDDGTWEVKAKVFFDVNKSTIREEAKPELDRLAKVMLEPGYADWKVEIQGHCDKSGPRKFNEVLSQKRAEAVMNYLIAKGVPADRLTAKGYCWDRPRYPNDREHRALNRRVEFKPYK